MASFEDILNKPVNEVERPKPLPQGTYLFLIEGTPNIQQIGQNKTDVADYTLKVLQPQQDVSPDSIAEIEGGVVGKTIRLRFFITDAAVWRLQQFLIEHLDLPKGQPLRQLMAQAPGRQVYGTIAHRPSDDGTQMFAEVRSTAKV